MLTSECVTAVRQAARLDLADDDWTDARIRSQLTSVQQSVFGHVIVQSKSGAWLKDQVIAAVDGKTRYRLPHRACVGIEDSVELVNAKQRYDISGDQVVFDEELGTDDGVVFRYYLRPPAMVAEQITATVLDGRVTSANATTGVVIVNTAPLDRVTGATIVSGIELDVIHPNGWHELAVVSGAATRSGTTLTFDPTVTDLSDVEVGDVVRAADQTDWPMLPDDFHDALCLAAAMRIATFRGHKEKAATLKAILYGSEGDIGEIARFKDILEPRVKKGSEKLIPQYGVIRGRFRRGWAAP